MITDNAGCSTTRPGEEQWERFYSHMAKDFRYQYEYRRPDGTLFSTVAKTLEAARARRDLWLESRKIGAAV